LSFKDEKVCGFVHGPSRAGRDLGRQSSLGKDPEFCKRPTAYKGRATAKVIISSGHLLNMTCATNARVTSECLTQEQSLME
jgi:hypothetical protein